MKLSKILIPTLSVASIASITVPTATSCACSFLKYLPANLMNIKKNEEDGNVYLYGFNDGVTTKQISQYKIFDMPDAVNIVMDNAFYDRQNNKSKLTPSIKELRFQTYYLDDHARINQIQAQAFKGAYFEKITFPYIGTSNEVIDLLPGAFDECNNLTELDFSNVFLPSQIVSPMTGSPFGSAVNNKGTIIIPKYHECKIREDIWLTSWVNSLTNGLGLKIDEEHWTLKIKE